MRREQHASALVPAIEEHRRAFCVKLKAKRSGRTARDDPRKPVGIRLSTGSFPNGLLLEEDLGRSKGISNRGCARCGWIHGVAGRGLTGGISGCEQSVQAPLIQSVYLWSDPAMWIVLSKIPGFIPCSTQRCAQPDPVIYGVCDAKDFSAESSRRVRNSSGSRRDLREIPTRSRARLPRDLGQIPPRSRARLGTADVLDGAPKTTPARRRECLGAGVGKNRFSAWNAAGSGW